MDEHTMTTFVIFSKTCEQQYLNVEEAKIKNFINGTVVDANK